MTPTKKFNDTVTAVFESSNEALLDGSGNPIEGTGFESASLNADALRALKETLQPGNKLLLKNTFLTNSKGSNNWFLEIIANDPTDKGQANIRNTLAFFEAPKWGKRFTDNEGNIFQKAQSAYLSTEITPLMLKTLREGLSLGYRLTFTRSAELNSNNSYSLKFGIKSADLNNAQSKQLSRPYKKANIKAATSEDSI